MSRTRNGWVLPVSILVAILLGLVPLPAPLQPPLMPLQTRSRKRTRKARPMPPARLPMVRRTLPTA